CVCVCVCVLVSSEQDQGLDQLSQALRRQREVGLVIQDEVVDQNLLIDDIQHGAEVANTKVRSQTRRIAEVRRKDSCRCTCCECIYHLYIGTSDKCSSEIDLSTKDTYLFQPHANTYKCII
ncbi:hypothetical protein GBAR_LOCUS28062, partial [Geodia barretti]